jgi:type I restriction enzyme, S subunit
MQLMTENIVVPKLRFGEYVNNWEIDKFSKYIKLYRGSSPRPISIYRTKNNGVNWIKIGDTKGCQNYVINNVSEQITVEGSLKSRKVEVGELILANSMSFGKTYLLNICGCIYDGWFVLREYEDNFNKHFLHQLLNSEHLQKQYLRLSTGGVVQNISSEIVYSTKLCKPSISEQQKIATFLSAVDEKLQQLTKKKELLEEYKKGVMQNIFSQELRFKDDNGNNYTNWEEKKITEIAKTSIGLVTSMTKHYVELGTPLIRNSDILQNKIKKDKLIYLNKEFDEDNRGRRLLLNDIVTVHTGDIGVSAVIESDLDGCQGFATLNTRIKNQDAICSAYLCWYYNSVKNIRYAISMATGDGRSNYNLKDFNKAIIPIPCIEEQQKISNFLSSLSSKIELVSAQIENTKAFKKGLLQQMFV